MQAHDPKLSVNLYCYVECSKNDQACNDTDCVLFAKYLGVHSQVPFV